MTDAERQLLLAMAGAVSALMLGSNAYVIFLDRSGLNMSGFQISQALLKRSAAVEAERAAIDAALKS